MRTVLHIVTKPNDEFAAEIIEHEKSLPNQKLTTVDLTEGKPDYNELVRQIFTADSIQVW
jgi:hypothetical protein